MKMIANLSKLQIVLIILGCIISSIFSITLCFRNDNYLVFNIIRYIVFALSFFLLIISIYILVQLFLHCSLKDIAYKTKLTRKLYDSYDFRVMFIGHASLITNIFFCITKGLAGFYYSSLWLIILAIYYLVLCIARIYILQKSKNRNKYSPYISSIKAISFASSCVSMLALQTAMFVSFPNDMEIYQMQLMNFITGTIVCVVLIICGILMVKRSKKEVSHG